MGKGGRLFKRGVKERKETRAMREGRLARNRAAAKGNGVLYFLAAVCMIVWLVLWWNMSAAAPNAADELGLDETINVEDGMTMDDDEITEQGISIAELKEKIAAAYKARKEAAAAAEA